MAGLRGVGEGEGAYAMLHYLYSISVEDLWKYERDGEGGWDVRLGK